MPSDHYSTIEVSQELTVELMAQAAAHRLRFVLGPETRERLDSARARVVRRLSAAPSERVYGFNTGFADNRAGPTIPPESWGVLQDNLILSHCAGYGDPVLPPVVRAAIAVRLHTLALGNSGVRPVAIQSLCDLYNSDFVPVVPSFGSVGASGDLAPLSHVAAILMGQGSVWTPTGERILASEAEGLPRLSYSPSEENLPGGGPASTFGPKEGLALNNGTSFMAAWLALAVNEVENLLWHADLALSMSLQALCGVHDAFEEPLQALRPHPGAVATAARVRQMVEGSQLLVRRGVGASEVLQARTKNGTVDTTQDDYCLRAGAIVHGTVWQALDAAKKCVEVELNSVNDNPVLVDGVVLSGSHFHGMPLAVSADQLRAAMAVLGGISERRVAKLTNDRRNNGLPRHLVASEPGVRSGWMLGQYLAASLVNELKTRSMPYSVGNVTTGNEAEDFVSMGANACRSTNDTIPVLAGVVAVETGAAARALLLRTRSTGLKPSPFALKVIQRLAEARIPVDHEEDRPLEPIVSQLTDFIHRRTLRNA